MGLADRSLDDLLTATAEATPAPGGGSSAGVAVALAAALVEMSAGISGLGDVAAEAATLRAAALASAEEDLVSYAPVLEARRLPAEDPARAARIADALEAASRTPAAIAAAAERVAELADEVVAHGRASVAGDAAAGASLARAAGAAAAHLVALNRAG